MALDLPAYQDPRWDLKTVAALQSLDVRTLGSLIALDTGSRPDSAGPGSTDSGQAYTAVAGSASVSGGKVVVALSSTVLIDAGTSDVDVSALVTHQGGAPGLVVRSDSTNLDRLAVQLDQPNGALRLQKIDTGATPVQLDSAAVTFVVDGTRTYRLRVVAKANLVRAYLDGDLLLSYQLTDAEQVKYGAYTRVGYRASSGGGALFDQLVVAAPAALEDNSPIMAVTGDYTLTRADTGKTIEQLSSSSSTLLVPTGLIPRGSAVYLVQIGAGAWSVAPGSGMTVRNAGTLPGQYKGATLYARSATEAVLL